MTEAHIVIPQNKGALLHLLGLYSWPSPTDQYGHQYFNSDFVAAVRPRDKTTVECQEFRSS